MKRAIWIWNFIVIIAAVVLFLRSALHGGSGDTVEYQGEHFKMAKSYQSYEDYKDDPNNLDTNELPRIEAAIRAASIGTNFDTRKQFIRAVFSLKFPGYGLEQFGERPQPDGSSISMFSVEIPQREEDRYLVAHAVEGRFTLVDDFVASSATNTISQVKLEGKMLRYYDAAGSLVREHEMSP